MVWIMGGLVVLVVMGIILADKWVIHILEGRKIFLAEKLSQIEKEKEEEPRDWSYRVIWRRKIKDGIVTAKYVVQRYERYEDDEANFATWEDKKTFSDLIEAERYAADQMRKDVRREIIEEMVVE
jgi:hypothetical protein